MPKRIGHLYEKMFDRDLIQRAIAEGTKGKRGRWDVEKVLTDVDGYVEKMHDMLIAESYVPTKPKSKVIFDKSSQKQRIIRIVPFYPDGLMHQLCVMAMKDVLMRGMYRWSCASIPGRGNRCAAEYVRKALDNAPKETRYCLKMDIKQYYPSIRPKRLIKVLARKIKDRRFLKLVYSIAASDPDGGLAIGFYINQWLANFYLESLDHYICDQPGVKYYVRNMDDMVILGPNKKMLHAVRRNVEAHLRDRLGLRLKEIWQVFPVKSRAIDFDGTRFNRNHTTMRRRNFLRYARQCRRERKRKETGQPVPFTAAAGLLARAGQLKHCNSHGIRVKYFDPVGAKRLKAAVRAETKKRLADGGGNGCCRN